MLTFSEFPVKQKQQHLLQFQELEPITEHVVTDRKSQTVQLTVTPQDLMCFYGKTEDVAFFHLHKNSENNFPAGGGGVVMIENIPALRENTCTLYGEALLVRRQTEQEVLTVVVHSNNSISSSPVLKQYQASQSDVNEQNKVKGSHVT